jgi:hypothetical protein
MRPFAENNVRGCYFLAPTGVDLKACFAFPYLSLSYFDCEYNIGTMTRKKTPANRYPCHCCHKAAAVYWSEKRQCFICENCLKTFDRAVIAKRNGLAVEQLSLC